MASQIRTRQMRKSSIKENIKPARNSTQRLSDNYIAERKGSLVRNCSEQSSRRHLSVLNGVKPSSRGGSLEIKEEEVISCSFSADVSVFEDSSSKLNSTK